MWVRVIIWCFRNNFVVKSRRDSGKKSCGIIMIMELIGGWLVEDFREGHHNDRKYI